MWLTIILYSLVSILGIFLVTGYERFAEKKEYPIKYNARDLTAYRRNIAEDIKKKELNRDFNYEVPLFYKTPYQFLDYQDLLINDNDLVYSTRMSNLANYLQDEQF